MASKLGHFSWYCQNSFLKIDTCTARNLMTELVNSINVGLNFNKINKIIQLMFKLMFILMLHLFFSCCIVACVISTNLCWHLGGYFRLAAASDSGGFPHLIHQGPIACNLVRWANISSVSPPSIFGSKSSILHTSFHCYMDRASKRWPCTFLLTIVVKRWYRIWFEFCQTIVANCNPIFTHNLKAKIIFLCNV